MSKEFKATQNQKLDNQDLNDWNMSSVQTIEGMFMQATSFNKNINNWNVSGVIDMMNVF